MEPHGPTLKLWRDRNAFCPLEMHVYFAVLPELICTWFAPKNLGDIGVEQVHKHKYPEQEKVTNANGDRGLTFGPC